MFEKIAKYLSEQMDISMDEITPDTTFESLGIDSLDTVEMVMDLEDQFGIMVEDDQIMKLRTVGDVVDYIEKNQ